MDLQSTARLEHESRVDHEDGLAKVDRQEAARVARSLLPTMHVEQLFLQVLDEVDHAPAPSSLDLDGPGGPSTSSGVRGLIDSAALALVTTEHLSDRQFAVLYGPFWRAVVRRVRPYRRAPWNPMLLAGFWFCASAAVSFGLLGFMPTIGAVGLFLFVGLVFGPMLLLGGLVLSMAHDRRNARRWPEPPRTSGPVAILRRIWRAPDSVFGRLTEPPNVATSDPPRPIGSGTPWVASDLTALTSGLIAEARTLNERQAARLAAEVAIEIRVPSQRNDLGRILVGAAVNEDVERLKDDRQEAIAVAQSAVARSGRASQLEGILAAAAPSTSSADPWPPAAGTCLEWAALALVAVDSLTDVDFAALYGPWWRAVVRDIRPVWGAPWSTSSLAGCWLLLVGVVLAPFVNRGDAGYATLGILAAGAVLMVVGAVGGTIRSRPWPEPMRPTGNRRADQRVSFVHRLWRAPETITGKVISLDQPH